VTDGDLLRLRDQVSKRLLRFRVTGLYRPRQLSGVSSEYWGLDDIGLSGSRTDSGFTTYGPLTVQAAAFAGPLTVNAGSWLAQPATASIPADSLSTVAANVNGLGQALLGSDTLPDLTPARPPTSRCSAPTSLRCPRPGCSPRSCPVPEAMMFPGRSRRRASPYPGT
jgi:hypothetical protein